MDSNHDATALQSLMDFEPQDDKRLATDHTSIMQSEVPTAAVASDRPSTPPNQQQNPGTQPRSILRRVSSEFMQSTGEQETRPTAAESRRKVRFSSVEDLHEMVDEDRPRRSSTASPPPPGNNEDIGSDDDEIHHHHVDGNDEDEEITIDEPSKILSKLHHILPTSTMDYIDFSDKAATKETNEKLMLATPRQLEDPVNESIKKMQELKHREAIARLSKEVNEEAREEALRLEKTRYEEECSKREHANILRQFITARMSSHDRAADVDPPSPTATRDSEGYDPHADVDPPSPSPPVESQSTATLNNLAEDVNETGKATTAAPLGGVTVVGKFNFDRFRGTFSSSNVRVLDSEGYDPNADIDPPSDDDRHDDADKTHQAPMKIFTAGTTALPQSTKTTAPSSSRRDVPSVPAPATQPAKATPSTPASATESVSEPNQGLSKPASATPSFPHTPATDDLIRNLRSSNQPLSAIADRVNETLASQGHSRIIDSNGIYSRLVMLKHIDGTNDSTTDLDRAKGRQSNLFTPGTSARAANVREGQKKTTFSAKEDEALVRIYNERRARFWGDVAEEMERETGRRFEERELEERFAAI